MGVEDYDRPRPDEYELVIRMVLSHPHWEELCYILVVLSIAVAGLLRVLGIRIRKGYRKENKTIKSPQPPHTYSQSVNQQPNLLLHLNNTQTNHVSHHHSQGQRRIHQRNLHRPPAR